MTPAKALAAIGLALMVGGGAAAVLERRDGGGGPPRLVAPPPRDPYRSEILASQAAASARPDDPGAWAELAIREVEGVRLGGDPSGYTRAERAVERALDLDDRHAAALRAAAVLANARHDFEEALTLARRAVEANPASAAGYGPLADALVELGRYDEAATATQAMVDRRPNLASYARVSYLRELRGDVPGAMEAMEAAERSAGTPADKSFTTFQLGELAWQQGQLAEAERRYRRAEQLDPQNAAASAGTARVLAAQGDVEGALSRLRALVDRQPQPNLLVELSDLQLAAGKADDATRTDALLDAQRRLFEANGVDLDLELAIHSADRRRDLARGLAQARDGHRRRPSVFAADALAWQLFANGKPEEARRYADEALRLGTPRASFHWHRAQIRRAVGDHAGADDDVRATARLNPRFSPLHTQAVLAAIELARSH